MDTTDHPTRRRVTRRPEAHAELNDRELGRALARLADATRAHVICVLMREDHGLRAEAVDSYRIPGAAIPAMLSVVYGGWTRCPHPRRHVLGRVVRRVLADERCAWGPELASALGQVVALVHARCLDIAARTVGRVVDAEDIVGEFEFRLPGLAIWFESDVSTPWPWLRNAVRRQSLDWLRRRAREGLRVDVDLDEIMALGELDAADSPDDAADSPDDTAEISFDEVIIAAMTSARRDAQAELLRHVAMWRDHELARNQGDVDLGALAQQYFGNDTKRLRNRVSQYCKRVEVRLERAARRLMSAYAVPRSPAAASLTSYASPAEPV